MTKTNIEQISFSDQMMSLAQQKMNDLGIDFSEYIRHLIMNDTSDLLKKKYYMSDDLGKRVSGARKEYEQGDYITLKDEGEIKEYINKTVEELI